RATPRCPTSPTNRPVATRHPHLPTAKVVVAANARWRPKKGRIATMRAAEMTREQLLAVVHNVRNELWLVGAEHTPDKEWRPETLEDIAQILTEAGLGPVANQPAPKPTALDDERQEAAEDAFANYDLGDAVVADTC